MYVADLFIITAIFWFWKSRKDKTKFNITILSKVFVGLGVLKIILIVLLNKNAFQFGSDIKKYLTRNEYLNYSSYHYSFTLFYPVWASYYYLVANNRIKNDKNFPGKQELESYRLKCFNNNNKCNTYVGKLLYLSKKSNKKEKLEHLHFFEENFLSNNKISKILNCKNESSYVKYLALYSEIKSGKKDYYGSLLSAFKMLEDELNILSRSCISKSYDLLKFELVYKPEDYLIETFKTYCLSSNKPKVCTGFIRGARFAENTKNLEGKYILEDKIKSFCKRNIQDFSCKDFLNSLNRRQQGLNLLLVK